MMQKSPYTKLFDWMGLIVVGALLVLAIAGCSKDPVQPSIAQPTYAAQAPAPVVVQAAPQSSGAGDMLVGAAAGAMLMNSMSNSSRDYDRRATYSRPIERRTVVHKTVVHKTVIKQARPASRPKVSLAKRR